METWKSEIEICAFVTQETYLHIGFAALSNFIKREVFTLTRMMIFNGGIKSVYFSLRITVVKNDDRFTK